MLKLFKGFDKKTCQTFLQKMYITAYLYKKFQRKNSQKLCQNNSTKNLRNFHLLPKTRTRDCVCPGATCFPCFEILLEEDICDTTACPFGEFSDSGTCSYHSDCCQTVEVRAAAESTNPVDGHYRKSSRNFRKI